MNHKRLAIMRALVVSFFFAANGLLIFTMIYEIRNGLSYISVASGIILLVLLILLLMEYDSIDKQRKEVGN